MFKTADTIQPGNKYLYILTAAQLDYITFLLYKKQRTINPITDLISNLSNA